ncbi:ubiquitin carboxyl-terminal hydrolase 43-like isoform X2 [Varroa destructor]|uniref:ubiquitinyl hydrolase 1 n=1 Tax=Varroa destructor TaxID=109461 RepID=A0A7M7J0M2_VARDE|nr:ubiquitin carboxyl-terminal hydrolase 43-like isoform X2 [Varroa destructor]
MSPAGGGVAVVCRSTAPATASSGRSVPGGNEDNNIGQNSGTHLANEGIVLPSTTMQRRSASERDLVEGLVPRRRQSPSRTDRGLFTLPRLPLKKSCPSSSTVGFVGRRDIKYTSLENTSDATPQQTPTLGRSSRSTERRSIFSSIVRSFSVKRPPAKKNLSLSNGDLTRPAATGHRPTRLTVGALRNDEACDYDKAVDDAGDDGSGMAFVVGGIAGIRNHGNTCYLNAIVQCLSNTDAFAEYLVLNRYQVDLSYARKNNRKKYGTRGEVTEQLALLIKSLWSSTMYPEISARLKSVVGKYGPQYAGSEQHDAQEFLIWLLDKVHEDLNRANKTKYKKVDSKGSVLGKPDEFLAARALASHARCNSSFVQELFQGQTKLTLTCPLCRRECKTFDPYVCLSLPIPLKLKRLVPVHLINLTGDNRQLEFAIELFDNSTIRDLREKVSDRYRIPARNLLFMQLLPETEGGFGSVYADSDSVVSLLDDLRSRGNSRFVTCLETPKPKKTNEHGEHVMVIWQNRTTVGGPFGPPYVIQVRRDISFDNLRLLMLDTMAELFNDEYLHEDGDCAHYDGGTEDLNQQLLSGGGGGGSSKELASSSTQYSFRNDERHVFDLEGVNLTPRASTDTIDNLSHRYIVHQQTDKWVDRSQLARQTPATSGTLSERPIVPEFPTSCFSILCADMLPERNELRASDELPLYTDPVEHITAVQYPSVAKHLRLVLEWRDERICERIREPSGPLRDESLCGLDEADGEAAVPVDLNDCLNAYFSEELLEADEAWLCPTCERRQQVLSKLDLWTTPDVLLIHLKRFKQVNQERSKISSLVEFPLTGLDLSRFAAQRGDSPDLLRRERDRDLPKDTFFTWSPWKNSVHRSPLRNVDPRNPHNFIYDLYAVCNHHGTMQTGHYTAFCKNPVNGLWYHYDDAIVSTVTDESHLTTRDAYILFYQRNTFNVSQSCSSSSSGYSSGSNDSANRHWSIHREQFFYSSAPSSSFDNLYNNDRQTQTPQPRRKWRNTKRYATMGSGERRSRGGEPGRPLTAENTGRPNRDVMKDVGSDTSLVIGGSTGLTSKDVSSCVPKNSQSAANINELYAEADEYVLRPAIYCTVTSV